MGWACVGEHGVGEGERETGLHPFALMASVGVEFSFPGEDVVAVCVSGWFALLMVGVLGTRQRLGLRYCCGLIGRVSTAGCGVLAFSCAWGSCEAARMRPGWRVRLLGGDWRETGRLGD